jgi:hypothetical protein
MRKSFKILFMTPIKQLSLDLNIDKVQNQLLSYCIAIRFLF